ncbi:DUF2627 domain-containing protein [Salinicoccus albus]|uniref:DUF2627 domain-containing protein n=1 Tax=Salinicoccus albus TaxID=418756 RepID=UPI00037ABF10|nr:DUF2627 domain-containing protein [Salinicoccus albus]
MRKIIALAILFIPVIMAGFGIKFMRDSVFGVVNDPFTLTFVQFAAGLLLTVFGVWFIGGYLLHRERKNRRVQERFQEKIREKEIENAKRQESE